MLKIAIFGFFRPDQARISLPHEREDQISPVSTDEFMRAVAGIEPGRTPTGYASGAPCFVKLNGIASQPVYVQSLSNQMAPGAGLLNCDGYVAIIDAVKILAPRTIESALRRLGELHPHAHVIVAAGRQNEPEALSAEDIRSILGLHPDLPVYPYVPNEPKTAHRLVRRLARYIDDPHRAAPPIFADAPVLAATAPPAPAAPPPAARPAPPEPHIHGLDHVVIAVSDLTRALDFYRGLLGFRLLGQVDAGPDATVSFLDTGRGLLGLYHFDGNGTGGAMPPSPPQPGAQHVMLRVVGLDAIADQLFCADAPCLLEPTAIAGRQMAFFADPDGTVIGLVEGEIGFTRR